MFNLMSIISNFFKSKKNKTTNKLNNNRDEFIGYVFEFETGNTNKKNIFTRSMKLYQKSNNKTQLNSFTEFCRRHPELRFWQALAAWSGYDYIYVSNSGKKDLKDTFYL